MENKKDGHESGKTLCDTACNFLTEAGYLQKNSLEADKADFLYNVNQEVCFTEAELKKIEKLADGSLKERLYALKTAKEFFTSSVVTFTQKGRVVITNFYTELGASYLNACGFKVKAGKPTMFRGNYKVEDLESDAVVKIITVELDSNLNFGYSIDLSSGSVYQCDIFTKSKLIAFTKEMVIANSGIGYMPVLWEEGKDGTSFINLRYGDEERNLMDLYLPSSLDKTRENGILLFIHGGAWTQGGKEEMTNNCKRYAKLGYITATMSHSYAMSPLKNGKKATFYTIDNEVKGVLAKIKELSNQNGWNITKCALSGYSSGCHIAYLYAYGQGLSEDAPLKVKFVSGMVGCLDFRSEYWQNVTMDGPAVAALGLNDVKLTDKDNPYSNEEYNAIMDSISPLSFAKKGRAVPSIIAYAELDETLIDYVFASVLEKTLGEFGIENKCLSLPNSGHITGNNPEYVIEYNLEIQNYLKKYFN